MEGTKSLSVPSLGASNLVSSLSRHLTKCFIQLSVLSLRAPYLVSTILRAFTT